MSDFESLYYLVDAYLFSHPAQADVVYPVGRFGDLPGAVQLAILISEELIPVPEELEAA